MKAALCALLAFSIGDSVFSAGLTPDEVFAEVSDLFRTKARTDYSTEQEMIKTHSKFDMQSKDNSYNLVGKSHPYVIKLNDKCTTKCQVTLSKKFSNDRYTTLGKNYAMVVASLDEIESYQRKHPDSILFQTVLHPDLKVAPEIRKISLASEGCLSQSLRYSPLHAADKLEIASEEFKVLVDITPLSPDELTEFLAFAAELSVEYKNAFQFDFDAAQNSPSRAMRGFIRTTHCDKMVEIVNRFAQRREVSWMERSHNVVVHNRWANGVCDNNDYSSSQLDYIFLNGTGEIVGVSDTGIDMSNCYFHHNITFNFQSSSSLSPVLNMNHRKVLQYIYQDTTDKFDDNSAHGTHVAGTVAGLSEENYGDYELYKGMAHGARIAFFDIGKTGIKELKLPNNLDTNLFLKMYQAGARVMTNSWGSEGEENYDAKAKDVDTFMRRYPESLLLFSAGNTGSKGPSSVGSPASAKNVATIGASLNDHESWKAYSQPSISEEHSPSSVAYFSSQGPTGSNLLKPDFLAPGWFTTSAAGIQQSSTFHCTVKALSGTSMAAPTAAGFAVKAREYYMKGYYPSGSANAADGFIPSGALLKATLMHSAQKMTHLVKNNTEAVALNPNAYPSNIQGYGRILMSKVLNFGASAADPLSMFVVGSSDDSQPHYVELTQLDLSNEHTFRPVTTDPIRITMCYTDLPALTSAPAGSIMQNTLRLSVKDGNNIQHTPYAVSGTQTSTCQMIDLTGSEVKVGQTYTITVAADFLTVPSDTTLGLTQPYALVVTGAITYLSVEGPKKYTAPQHSDSYISSGSVAYIATLAVIVLLMLCIVYYFYRITRKSRDLLIDPTRGAWTGEGQAGAMGMVLRMRQRALDQKNQKAGGNRNSADFDEYAYE